MNPEEIETIEAGDKLTITYESARKERGDTDTLESEVVDTEFSHAQGYLFGYIYLAEYRDEDDPLPRRRVRIQADDVTDVEYRRTTRNGAKWERLSRTATTEMETWF